MVNAEAYSKGNCIQFCIFFSVNEALPYLYDYEFTVHIFLQFTKRTKCSRSVAEFLRCTFQVCKTRIFFCLVAFSRCKALKICNCFLVISTTLFAFWTVSKALKVRKSLRRNDINFWDYKNTYKLCEHLFSHWDPNGQKKLTLAIFVCAFFSFNIELFN